MATCQKKPAEQVYGAPEAFERSFSHDEEEDELATSSVDDESWLSEGEQLNYQSTLYDRDAFVAEAHLTDLPELASYPARELEEMELQSSIQELLKMSLKAEEEETEPLTEEEEALITRMQENNFSVKVPQDIYYRTDMPPLEGSMSPPAPRTVLESSYDDFNRSNGRLRSEIVVALLQAKSNLTHSECRRYLQAKHVLTSTQRKAVLSSFQEQLARALMKKEQEKRKARRRMMIPDSVSASSDDHGRGRHARRPSGSAGLQQSSSLNSSGTDECSASMAHSLSDFGKTQTRNDGSTPWDSSLKALSSSMESKLANYVVNVAVLCAVAVPTQPDQAPTPIPIRSIRIHVSYGSEAQKSKKVPCINSMFSWHNCLQFKYSPGDIMYFELVGSLKDKSQKLSLGVAWFDVWSLHPEKGVKTWLPISGGMIAESPIKLMLKVGLKAQPRPS